MDTMVRQLHQQIKPSLFTTSILMKSPIEEI